MVASRQRWVRALVALSGAVLLVLAYSMFWPTRPEPSSPSKSDQPRPAAKELARALPVVRTLYEQGTSAYHARMFANDEGVVLVTQTGFTTFGRDGATEEHTLSLGPVAARRGDALVFWRAGSLREVSLLGSPERELAAVQRPPQYLLTTDSRLAWIHTDRETGTSLQTASDGHVRVVYESPYGASAPVMRAASVYWVAERRDGSWTIGCVDLDGKPSMWSATHHGRPPAMLAVGPDGVYFYDGVQRGLRRLTFDLEQETTVLTGAVCSPLVVSNRVVCAQVGGLFEVPLSGAAPRFLASERAGPVTALAATRDRAFWVTENGAERLIVRMVALHEP